MPDLLKQQLERCLDLQSVLNCALNRSLALTGTVLGNLQVMDWRTGYLTIEAQRGFNDDFLTFFRRVNADDGSACARAIRNRSSIVIKDVLVDREFAPCREIVIDAGVRAVQSTPLISSRGAFLGVLSTHFEAVHTPSVQEMQAMKQVAKLTANAILRRRGEKNTREQIREAFKAIQSSGQLLRRINAAQHAHDARAERVLGGRRDFAGWMRRSG